MLAYLAFSAHEQLAVMSTVVHLMRSVLSIKAPVSSTALPPHADSHVHIGKRSISMRIFKPVR